MPERRNNAIDQTQYLPHADGMLFVPDNITEGLIVTPRPTGIIALSDDELLKYTKTEQQEKESRNSTEIARALFNPGIFLAGELSKQLPNDPTTTEVIGHLIPKTKQPRLPRSQKRKIIKKVTHSADALVRKSTVVPHFDIYNKESTERVVTTPGPLEQIAIAMVDMIEDPGIKASAGHIVIRPLSKLLQDYRNNNGRILETPEMPDLAAKVIGALDEFPISPAVRSDFYFVLEQIGIPNSQRVEILQKMDQCGDLSHPLAYKLTLEEATNKDSDWIKLQRDRRHALLEKLEVPHQQVFDQYAELKKESQRLVFHDSAKFPVPGKVGMEIEFSPAPNSHQFIYNVKETPEMEAISQYYYRRGLGVDRDWAFHMETVTSDDTVIEEITRADNQLDFNEDYLYSLHELSQWLRGGATTLNSLHIHLDASQHPFIPNFSGLFDGYDPHRTHSRTIDRAARNNATYEIRAVALPRTDGTFHPARLADIIGMFIYAAEQEHDPKKIEKLALTPGVIAGKEQLIWGHLTSFLPEAEGRLAALMSLGDENALSFINPLAFFHTYQDADLQTIAESLREHVTDSRDKKMLKTLYKLGAGNFIEPLSEVGADHINRGIAQDVLGYEYLRELSDKYEYSIYDNGYDWFIHHREILVAKYGFTRSSPRSTDSNHDGVFDREEILKGIRTHAKNRLEVAINRKRNPDEPQEPSKAELQYTFNFDQEMLTFMSRSIFHLLDDKTDKEFFYFEDKPAEKELYLKDKQEDIKSYFKLFYVLSAVSDELTDKVLKKEDIQFNETTFAIDEDNFFEQRGKQMYKELETVNTEEPEGYATVFKHLQDLANYEEGITFLQEPQIRTFIAPLIAVMIWAIDHGFEEDARFDPVKEVIMKLGRSNNFPLGYTKLIKNNFLGVQFTVDYYNSLVAR